MVKQTEYMQILYDQMVAMERMCDEDVADLIHKLEHFLIPPVLSFTDDGVYAWELDEFLDIIPDIYPEFARQLMDMYEIVTRLTCGTS